MKAAKVHKLNKLARELAGSSEMQEQFKDVSGEKLLYKVRKRLKKLYKAGVLKV
jgi:hypothetical protein